MNSKPRTPGTGRLGKPKCASLLAIYVTVLCMSLASSLSQAQVLLAPGLGDGSAKAVGAKKTERPKSTVIKIHGAAEPDPAIHYRFWPASEDRVNGNMMPFVSRAILMTSQRLIERTGAGTFSGENEKWSKLSLSELPKDAVREMLSKKAYPALSELERAENLMRIDYDLRPGELTPNELIQTLLPDLQQMRSVARLLSLRCRLAAAEGRWNDFARDCRLGFRLSEAAARSGDFLVSRLVGFAISGMMLGNIEEAMQQPGCPNLYWALVTIPVDHLFEIRESLEFESALLTRLIDTKKLPNEPIGEVAARQMIRQLSADAAELLGVLSDDAGKFNSQFLSGVYVVSMADQAREDLEATEKWKGRAKDLSAAEAVLRSTRLRINRMKDDWLKWSLLPPELVGDYQKEIEQAMETGAPNDILRTLVLQLTPAVMAAKRSGMRSRQYRNFLLTIEALRMHASVNGELPKKLDGLRPVPAWHDSLTQKPFEYLRTSPTTAMLIREARHSGDKETNFEIQLTAEAAK